ncbi:MAG: shikimate kinase [Pirellulaceae bacterium]|jgi:shikimate kinase|nr:shikimate kinase [Pirellulaceae bacterium]
MNVVLIGYRGTGKTSVAAQLAQQLGLEAVHLDAEIERRAGRSIPEMVAELGWPGFRDLEEAVVRDSAARQGVVLDCGGGVVEREANFDVLRRSGPVVWLRASVPVIVQRIAGDSQRPSLTGTRSFTDEVAEVLARRTPLYQRLAHYEVDTDGRSIDQIAQDIVRMLDL